MASAKREEAKMFSHAKRRGKNVKSFRHTTDLSALSWNSIDCIETQTVQESKMKNPTKKKDAITRVPGKARNAWPANYRGQHFMP